MYVAEKSYYIVDRSHVDEFTKISNELKQYPVYIDLCSTVLRPECQLFFDFYIFLSTEHTYVNHDRTLNVPIYAFLNEIASKHKQLKQFKQQYSEDKHMCMMASMHINKAFQQILADILLAMKLPLERIMRAIQQLENVPSGQQNRELIHMQGVILAQLKEHLQQEDTLTTIIETALQHAKEHAMNTQYIQKG